MNDETINQGWVDVVTALQGVSEASYSDLRARGISPAAFNSALEQRFIRQSENGYAVTGKGVRSAAVVRVRKLHTYSRAVGVEQ